MQVSHVTYNYNTIPGSPEKVRQGQYLSKGRVKKGRIKH